MRHSKPNHSQVRVLDSEVKALVPHGVETVVADGLGLELVVVVVGAADLHFDERGNDAAAGLPAQVPEATNKPLKGPFRTKSYSLWPGPEVRPEVNKLATLTSPGLKAQ